MQLTTCCGCCSVQKGSLIIGILSVVSGFISLIMTARMTALINTPIEDPNYHEPPVFTYSKKAICAGVLTYTITMLALSSLFVYGNIKRQPCFVLPYLSVSFANLLTLFAIIVSLLTMICSIPYLSGLYIFLCLLFSGLSLGLGIYFWLVIFYFYKELVSEGFGQIPRMQNMADLQ